MQTIGAFEAKTKFSAILEEVQKGKQIIITKHGHPVAKISPLASPNQEKVCQTIRQLKEFGKNNKLGGLDWKKLRDEGRR